MVMVFIPCLICSPHGSGDVISRALIKWVWGYGEVRAVMWKTGGGWEGEGGRRWESICRGSGEGGRYKIKVPVRLNNSISLRMQ